METTMNKVLNSAWSCHMLLSTKFPTAQDLERQLPEAGEEEKECLAQHLSDVHFC